MISRTGNSKLPPGAELMKAFLRSRKRVAWAQADLARELGCCRETVKQNAARLVKAGFLKIERHQRYMTYELVGGPRYHQSPLQTPLPEGHRQLLTFLKRRCERAGACTLTREILAKAMQRSLATISSRTAELRKRGLVRVVEHGNRNTYIVAGKAGAPNEPPLSPFQVELLKFLKRRCERTGSCSMSLRAMGKAMRRDLSTIFNNTPVLEKRGLITVTRPKRGRGRASWVKGGRGLGVYPNIYTVVEVPSETIKPIETAKSVSTRGRQPGDVNLKIAALLKKLGYPKRLQYHQVKGCFPPDRVAAAKSDSAERRKITKQANVVASRLLGKALL
jgi:DNA-binding MarR family transcriptional regulator